MSVSVSVLSRKRGEVRKFIAKFVGEEESLDDSVIEWIYVYNKPNDSIKIVDYFLSSCVNNYKERMPISLWIRVDDEDMIMVDRYNREEVVDLIHSYSGEKPE